MEKFIEESKVIAIIEEKQKALCPAGNYGRKYVSGSDRDKFDAWDEILDEIENIQAVDAEPIRHGEWFGTVCSVCGESVSFNFDCDYCPKCGAKMEFNHDVSEEYGFSLRLPCKVGDTVYLQFEYSKRIIKSEVKRIVLMKSVMGNKCYFIEPISYRGRLFRYYDSDFGKTVFLTREAAEQALKEMEDNDAD